ncbi:MAG: restriction endonuclease subunit S [Candidatus Thiodiazotropha taylori]
MITPTFRLVDLCTFMTGGTPKSSVAEYYEYGDIPWIVSGDIHQKEIHDCAKRITKAGLENSNAKLLPVNSVLIALNGQGKTRGTVALLRHPQATCNQSIVAMTPLDDAKLSPEYLYFYLKSQYKQIRNITGDKDRAGLNIPLLKSITIPLPPLPIQKQIAALLEKADTLRSQCKQMEQELNQLAQSVFLEMFGDPATNPKSFPKIEISEFAEVKTGSTPSRRNEEFWNGTVRWVKTGEVSGGKITSTEETISELALKKTNCKTFPINTILLAMYGQGKTRGRVGILGVPAATNQACAAILPSENILPDFLFEYLKIQYQQIRALGRGGNQENLNLSMVKSYPVLLPSMKQQQSFIDIISSISAQRKNCIDEFIQFEALFNTLMQNAFSGKLNLTKAA